MNPINQCVGFYYNGKWREGRVVECGPWFVRLRHLGWLGLYYRTYRFRQPTLQERINHNLWWR